MISQLNFGLAFTSHMLSSAVPASSWHCLGDICDRAGEHQHSWWTQHMVCNWAVLLSNSVILPLFDVSIIKLHKLVIRTCCSGAPVPGFISAAGICLQSRSFDHYV